MTLRVFPIVRAGNIQQATVRYAWDDWRENRELRTIDPALVARLDRISVRAMLAFACGSAEWMVYRFSELTDAGKAWDLLEAAWAMIVHPRYGIGRESWAFTAEEGWEGPIRDPIRKCLEYLEAGIYAAYWDDGVGPTVRTNNIVKLATYVMPDPGPYHQWVDRVLTRLEGLYPRNLADLLGDPVPREAVDPDFAFRLEDAEGLINNFLSGLDPGRNQFLRAPEDMSEIIEGEREFLGTPYSFSMEEERRSRGVP